jgi:hypothetical protein
MKIKISIGEFLLVIPLPNMDLSDHQRKLLIGCVISLFVNAVFIIFLKYLSAVDPLIKLITPNEKIAVMNLQEDEEVKKAREISENPRANRIRPNDSRILSDVDSKSDLHEVPKDMSDQPSNENKTGESENKTEKGTLTEDPFENNQPVYPFLKNQNIKNSFLEDITGRSEGKRGWSGMSYELNTYAWEHAAYFLKWKSKMTDQWYRITSRFIFNPYAPLGSMRIYVKMNRRGQLLDSRIVDYNCDKSYVTPAYASVLNSFPLDPLPANFPEDRLEITWTITITN